MIEIYTVEQARQTILRRLPPDDIPIPASLQQAIAQLFGEALTPEQAVGRILRSVRERGDVALQEWSERLDGVALPSFRVPPEQIEKALSAISLAEREALQTAAERVRRFHQKQPFSSWIMQSDDGTLGQYLRPIRRVGIYAPGGITPLPSTILMSAIPAQVAGVPEIVVTAPPRRESGEIAPILLAACALLDIREVYALGGAQAIAALAYGTETIPAVDKIVGPGNLFVTLAKRQVFGVVGIEGLAGPTETMIIADESANPSWVAADLLAQAEHDVLASAILLTPSQSLAQTVQSGVNRQLRDLPRGAILQQALQNRSGIVLVRDLEEAIELANRYAPEHLCLSLADPWRWSEKVQAAGGIFMGESSFEVLGDYNAGPSHVMPTSSTARFASPLNVWDFVHIISLVALTPQTAAKLSQQAAIIARAEGLEAHARAADQRAQALTSPQSSQAFNA